MFQRNSLLLGKIFWKCHSFNLFDSVFWSCYFVRMLKMMFLRTASSRVQLLLLKFSISSLSIILRFVCLGTLTSTEFMLIVTSSWWTDVFIVAHISFYLQRCFPLKFILFDMTSCILTGLFTGCILLTLNNSSAAFLITIADIVKSDNWMPVLHVYGSFNHSNHAM